MQRALAELAAAFMAVAFVLVITAIWTTGTSSARLGSTGGVVAFAGVLLLVAATYPE